MSKPMKNPYQFCSDVKTLRIKNQYRYARAMREARYAGVYADHRGRGATWRA